MDVNTVDRRNFNAIRAIALVADDEIDTGEREGIAKADNFRPEGKRGRDGVAEASDKIVCQRADRAAFPPAFQSIFRRVYRDVAKQLDAVGVVGQQRSRDRLAKPDNVAASLDQVRGKRAGFEHYDTLWAFNQIAFVAQRIAKAIGVQLDFAIIVNGDGAKLKRAGRYGARRGLLRGFGGQGGDKRTFHERVPPWAVLAGVCVRLH